MSQQEGCSTSVTKGTKAPSDAASLLQQIGFKLTQPDGLTGAEASFAAAAEAGETRATTGRGWTSVAASAIPALFNETYLSQVIAMVRQAQESRSRSPDLANRAAVRLTTVALGGGAVTLVTWLAKPAPPSRSPWPAH